MKRTNVEKAWDRFRGTIEGIRAWGRTSDLDFVEERIKDLDEEINLLRVGLIKDRVIAFFEEKVSENQNSKGI